MKKKKKKTMMMIMKIHSSKKDQLLVITPQMNYYSAIVEGSHFYINYFNTLHIQLIIFSFKESS